MGNLSPAPVANAKAAVMSVGLLPPECHPSLLRFACYWCACRDGADMPSIEDVDPVGMPWALPSVFILKRRTDGLFAYSLVGNDMASGLGGGIKGKTAYEVFEPAYAEWTEKRWQRAASERMGCYVRTRHKTRSALPVSAARVLFPLASGGPSVDALIGLTAFSPISVPGKREPIDEPDRVVRWAPVAEINY